MRFLEGSDTVYSGLVRVAGDGVSVTKPRRTQVQRARQARLRLLMATGCLSNTEVLRFALQQAVADLRGLGGMAHLCGAVDRRLRLAATSGLTRDLAQAWEDIGFDESEVPAQAVRESIFVWVPVTIGTDPTPARWTDVSEPPAGAAEQSRSFPEGTGLACVPLLDANGPLGTLSILTTAAGPPDAQEQAFLRTLAGRTVDRLRQTPPALRSLSPAWWQEPSGSRLQEAMRAVEVGTYDWNIRTGELYCDEVTLTAGGLDPETFDRRIESWLAGIHPDDLPRVLIEIDRTVKTRNVYSVEYRVRRPEGTLGWVEVRGQITVGEDNEPLHMTGTLWDTTQTRMAQDSIGHVLRHMSDGFMAVDASWRITYVNVVAEHLFGSSRSLLGRLLWDAAPDITAFGLETRSRQAVADGRPIGFDARSPGTGRWYHMRLVPVPTGLIVYFTDVTEKRRRDAERDRAAHAAATRAARIGELTSALAQALTVRDVVDAVADRVLPPFGATGLIVQAIEGEYLCVVGAAGYPQTFLDHLDGVRLSEAFPVSEVLRSRTPRFVASAEELASLYPEIADYPAIAGKDAWAFLPLIASGHPIGCCVISFARPRHLTAEERTLFTTLSALIAQAFERARLYDAEHTRAQELQRGMLPRDLPLLPAVTTAARYLPAGEATEAGGDWYDVIPLSAERVALVIGDVMGHGLSEAATMGRLRTAVHTLADLELSPDELLTHLNDLVSGLGDDYYATCLYAVYDSTTRICAVASAGHPPPAIVRPDGTVHYPDLAPAPPLGAASPPFDTVETHLPEGSLLVLYTDGMVESSTRDIDHGMTRLAQTLTAAQTRTTHRLPHSATTSGSRYGRDRLRETEPIERLCDAVTSALLPARKLATDDAALLIARTHGLTSEDIAFWPLPEHPIAASQARSHTRTQLSQWNLHDLATTTELLVSNVIRHAKGPIQLRLLRSETLTCEVSDGSLSTPRIRRAADMDEGGRGLQLVAALAHRWGARYTPTGKCIWVEQLLPSSDPICRRSPPSRSVGGPEAALLHSSITGDLDRRSSRRRGLM